MNGGVPSGFQTAHLGLGGRHGGLGLRDVDLRAEARLEAAPR
jgi:hypothetical protein